MESEVISLFGIDSEISSTSLTLDTYTATNRWQFLGAVNGVFGEFTTYLPNHTECTFYFNQVKNITDSEWNVLTTQRTFDENIADQFDVVSGAAELVSSGYNGQGVTAVVPDDYRQSSWTIFNAFATHNNSAVIRVESNGTVVAVERPGPFGPNTTLNAAYLRSRTDTGPWSWTHGDLSLMCLGAVRNVDIYNVRHDINFNFRLDSDSQPRAQVTFRGVAPGTQLLPVNSSADQLGEFNFLSSKTQEIPLNRNNGFNNSIYNEPGSAVSIFNPDRRRAQIISVSSSLRNGSSSVTYDQILDGIPGDVFYPHIRNDRQTAYDTNALIVSAIGNSAYDASVNSNQVDRGLVLLAYDADSENTIPHIVKTRSIAGTFLVFAGDSDMIVSNAGYFPGNDEIWLQDIALGTDGEFTSKNVDPSTQGSSFSTPKIAGCAAILFSKYINISAALVAMALKESGDRSNINRIWSNPGSRNGGPYVGYRGLYIRAIFGNGIVDVAAADQWIQTHCEFDDTRGYWVFKTTSMWHSRLTHEGYFIPAG